MHEFQRIVDVAKSLNILVVGDIMLDQYICGNVYRISPEAPVPVVAIDSDTYRLGGAANVALNLKKLGANVSVAGFIGNDSAGEEVLKLFDIDGIDISENCVLDDFSTTLKTRVIARGQQLCRLDREYNRPKNVLAHLKNEINSFEKYDAVILSDYAKGAINQQVVDFVVENKKRFNFFLAVDPKPSSRIIYRDASLITPNRTEALQMAGLPSSDIDIFDSNVVTQAIRSVHGADVLAITMGKSGMIICDKSGKFELFPTESVEVFDGSGAGDTAISALTLALTAKAEINIAAKFANVAAGVVVSKIGTATVSPEEILSKAFITE